MKNNLYWILVLTYFLISGNAIANAQTKRALLVGISKYQSYKSNAEWSDINGTNDIHLIAHDLKNQGFEQITQLLDEQATCKTIKDEFNKLTQSASKGDIIYFHFSGHGQPVLDLNGDEGRDDGWDEAIIPYDAGMIFQKDEYEGESHIIDDQLDKFFLKLRKKVGETGMVYAVLDACYSGTGLRGDDEDDEEIDEDAPLRGVNVGFDYGEFKIYSPIVNRSSYYQIPKEKNYSDIVVLEACLPHQQNREIKINDSYYGPLSYYIHEIIKNKIITKQTSWIGDVINLFNADKRTFRQKIVCESTIDNGKGY